MFSRPIILCLLYCITENIKVKEVRLRRMHLYVAFRRKKNGRSLGAFHTAVLFRKSGRIVQKSTYTFLVH